MPWHLTEAPIGRMTALAVSVAVDANARLAGPDTVAIPSSALSFPEPGGGGS